MDLKKYLLKEFEKDEKSYWKLREKLIKEYQGKWVAIHEDKIIAFGDNLYEVVKEAFHKSPCAYINKLGEEHKIVVRVRRKEFEYDKTYMPFAIPRADVKFENMRRESKEINVIPDTGADITCLTIQDFLDIDLFSSPGIPVESRRYGKEPLRSILFPCYVEINGKNYLSLAEPTGEIERLLGRDVLNQLTVTFKGKEKLCLNNKAQHQNGLPPLFLFL